MLYDEDELHYLDAHINLYTNRLSLFQSFCLGRDGVEEIKKALESKITLFSGHSGVGKSTLINSILPEQKVKPARFLLTITKVCIPPLSQKCFRRRQRIYHRHTGYQGIWYIRYGGRRNRTLFQKYSKFLPTANMVTVPTVMNRDVPYGKQ